MPNLSLLSPSCGALAFVMVGSRTSHVVGQRCGPLERRAEGILQVNGPRRACPHQGEDDLVRDHRGDAGEPGCVS